MRNPIEHQLDTWPVYWHAIQLGHKTFEVRRNDRAFQTGDVVALYCTVNDKPTSMRTDGLPLRFRIGWILQGGQFGIEPGYCVFSLAPIDENEAMP